MRLASLCVIMRGVCVCVCVCVCERERERERENIKFLTPHPSLLTELISHPLTPLYVLGKVSTYKTYLIATGVRDCYPRYDKPTPELFKMIAQEYVNSIKSSADSFDRESSVLKRRVGVVKHHVAPISEHDLKNPHIRFFNERNPGWREVGVCMCVCRRCVERIFTIYDIFAIIIVTVSFTLRTLLFCTYLI